MYSLNDEANHVPVFALGKMAEKLWADTAVIDLLIGSRLNLDIGEFPRPNGRFDKCGFDVVDFAMR